VKRPLFLYDIASVYAWLAAERIEALLPEAEWRPILLGGLFAMNGRHSWLLDPGAGERFAEVGRRAEAYGLPQPAAPAAAARSPSEWPPVARPRDWLRVMRAATVARREGNAVDFALAAFRATHVEGRDLTGRDELASVLSGTGLDADHVLAATDRQDVKDELRAITETAHARGVPGVPTVIVGEQVFWGDDRLEDAVAAAASNV